MTMHLFLTGEVQVGKSTAIRRFLAQCPQLRVGGFHTVAVPGPADGWDSVHLLPATVDRPTTADTCVMTRRGVYPDRQRQLFPAVFDTVGVPLLAQPCDLLLMDELGFAEDTALAFQQAVLDCLDGPTPVLGVLRSRGGLLPDKVRQHPHVRVVTVTQENRDHIPEELMQWLR
jgi:nucleoside-triphosphatase